MVAIREFETHPSDLYSETMRLLKSRLSLFVVQGFLEPLSFIDFDGNTLSLGAPSVFHADWVKTHYLDPLQEGIDEVFGCSIKIRLIGKAEESGREPSARSTAYMAPVTAPTQIAPVVPIASLASKPFGSITPLKAFQQNHEAVQGPVVLESAFLNPANTFETFVEGPSNSMGLAASKAVARQPGAHYSPLFLFGPAGIGKTHLLQAIGLYALEQNAQTRVLHISAEQWVNAYIQAIREKRFDAFRKKFRSDCDILLIDDIQFLAGKDASQDEFFHTFNSLHQAHKQIVVTSDKYPHEIEGLEERLQTRLSWGLIADLRPPELETRISILRQKATRCGIELPDDVAEYLALQVTTSVRELEGALLRLSASLSVSKTPISLAAAKQYLSPVFRRMSSQLSVDKICEYAAAYYDLRPLDLRGQSRQRQVALARQVSMFFCREMMYLSLPEIGRIFGGRDHSTVLSSIRKINDLRERDVSLGFALERIGQQLRDSSEQ